MLLAAVLITFLMYLLLFLFISVFVHKWDFRFILPLCGLSILLGTFVGVSFALAHF
jgi:hypothetical protein